MHGSARRRLLRAVPPSRRGFAALPPRDAPLSDMRAYLEATVAENRDIFRGRGGRFSKRDWFKLCRLLSPGMHATTSNSLLVTLDQDRDGSLSETDVYSDRTARVLQARLNFGASAHALESAYRCLPRPPFEEDAAQEACLKRLEAVWDDVVGDWQLNGMEPMPLKMVMEPSVRKKSARAPKVATRGRVPISARLVGKPWMQTESPRQDVPSKPKAQAPQGLYMFGVSGCGKTTLLDTFLRSLPRQLPVLRVDWIDFQRDALRFTSQASASEDENVYDAAAIQILKKCKVLLLDGLKITSADDARHMKQLCRYLWARGVTTIITSNYRPDQLCEGGLNVAGVAFEEFVPDLLGQCPFFNFSKYHKVDHRVTNVEDDVGNFVHPVGEKTSQDIQGMQKALLGIYSEPPLSEEHVKTDIEFEIPEESESDVECELPAKVYDAGEAKSVKLALSADCPDGSKICQVDFSTLVLEPLGRDLYAALATEYDHVFVTGAPKLLPSEPPANLHRFVSFIELAYSRKCFLYIQADGPADEIFENPKAGREFISTGPLEEDYRAWVRMKSILKEMHTQKYQIIAWLARNHLVDTARTPALVV